MFRERTLRRLAGSCLAVIAILGLAGCAAGPGGPWGAPESDAAGFFAGLWHGVLLVVTLVVSFFTDEVRIYETHNAGVAYDIGFVLGVLIIWGNGVHVGLGRKRSRRREPDDLGDDVERRIRARIARWLDDEDEWKDIGEKLERKVKDRLRRWLEEDERGGGKGG